MSRRSGNNPETFIPPFRSLEWPPIQRVLGPGRLKSRLEHWKYFFRRKWAHAYIAPFLERINSCPAWRNLYENHTRLFHSPISGFLDRRFTVKERFTRVQNDLILARANLGEAVIDWIAEGRTLKWAILEADLAITLGLNEVNLQEGTWALTLRRTDGQRLYNLSFGFLSPSQLLVASVQGPAKIETNGLEVVKSLTKSAHGLRPPFLLLEALKAAAELWGIAEVLGIHPTNHIKGRWNQRRKRLRFDYVRFWHEAGGSRNAEGYWSIPAQTNQRALAEIPTNKRSLYRKRFALLDRLRAEIATNLTMALGNSGGVHLDSRSDSVDRR